MNDSNSLEATRALQHLERRRHLLERLIFVARSLESLKNSLENVIDQGGEQSEERPEVAATFAALGRKLRNMSDGEVKLRLGRLDRKLNGHFQQIHPLIEQLEDGGDDQETRLADAQDVIEEFRRLALTALALRLLLKHRGQPVGELHLPFERATLVRQLKGLESQERAARKQVVDEVASMAQDLDALLQKAELAAPMRELLQRIRAGLAENHAHLLAGKSIDSLPLALESIDFSEGPGGSFTPEPVPSAETQPAIEQASPISSDPVAEASPAGGARQGFWRSLWAWINAPWGVTWSDIRQGRKSDD